MVVLVTCKNKEESIKNEGVRVGTRFSPLQPYGSYLLPLEPVLIRFCPKPNAVIPPPNDVPDEI